VSKRLDKIRLNTTCFSEHERCNVSCSNKMCRLWIDSEKNLNCTVLAAKDGPKTLQEIGDVFKVTRMRICQIEKAIFAKLITDKNLSQK